MLGSSFCSCAASLTLSLCVLLTACSFRVVEAPLQLVIGFVLNCPTLESWPRLLWNTAHGTQNPPSSDAGYVSHWYSSSHFALNCPWQPFSKRFGKAKLLSIAQSVLQYASLSESETPSPAPLLANKRPMSNPGIELGAVTDWLRERCSSSSGLLVDSFEDEGFRICSDALFELQRRRVMTRQGTLVSEQAKKKRNLPNEGGVRSNLRTYVSYAPGPWGQWQLSTAETRTDSEWRNDHPVVLDVLYIIVPSAAIFSLPRARAAQ